MEQIYSLNDCLKASIDEVGGKAWNLSKIIGAGFRVPKGICVSSSVYKDFINRTGIKDYIFYELGRKDLGQMRWEEMWDASLRIRNRFLREEMPKDISSRIMGDVEVVLGSEPIAVRSSSNFEDSEINSYAGLHESHLNVSGEHEILKCIKLVWASLWSDASIAYSRDLDLDPDNGSMAVVLQQILPGEVSGVAFGVSPIDDKLAVVEAVAGLNKGLVDGDVEPERWQIDRKSGSITDHEQPSEKKKTVCIGSGTRIVDDTTRNKTLLNDQQVQEIFGIICRIEDKMGFKPDVEWTFFANDLYLLQVRPISPAKFRDDDERRGWDMTLRRSFDNLKRLGGRITGELIPQMVKDAQRLEAVDLDTLVDSALAEELKSRESVYNKWKGVYWDEFIPFAHGARLFGQVYNDRMGPDDPHEFIEIISAEEAVSVKRNRAIEALAKKVLDQPGIIGEDLLVKDDKLKKDMLELLKNFPGLAAAETDDEAKLKVLSSIIRKTAFSSRNRISTDKRDPKQLENKFIESFNGDEKKGAIELLELGKLSYRLRDDDNVYLGRIESELMRAMSISTKRLGKRCEDNRTCQAAEEVIMALKMPDYQPKQQINEDAGTETRPASSLRQMRGQPAGKGIARGKARVVRSRADLFKVQDGEIIVCDSVDPEMTFIIPVVAGLVERRGGMLIHGAIIAREYGIPCVTGVEDAPVRIKTGSEITVDGYFGLVIDHSVSEKV